MALNSASTPSALILLVCSRRKPDVTRKRSAGSSASTARSAYPCSAPLTSICEKYFQPTARISSENPYLAATESSECQKQSAKAAFSRSSERMPQLAFRIAANAGAHISRPLSPADARQLSRSNMMALGVGQSFHQGPQMRFKFPPAGQRGGVYRLPRL